MIEILIYFAAVAWYAAGLVTAISNGFLPPDSILRALWQLTLWPWYVR